MAWLLAAHALGGGAQNFYWFERGGRAAGWAGVAWAARRMGITLDLLRGRATILPEDES